MIRESDIERYLVSEVRKAGGRSYKWVSPGRNGVPDRIVLLNGYVFFIEVKAPNKRPSSIQERVMDELREQGQRAFYVDSHGDIDTFIESN